MPWTVFNPSRTLRRTTICRARTPCWQGAASDPQSAGSGASCKGVQLQPVLESLSRRAFCTGLATCYVRTASCHAWSRTLFAGCETSQPCLQSQVNFRAKQRCFRLHRAISRRAGGPDIVVKYMPWREWRSVEEAIRHELRGMQMASSLEACLPLLGAYVSHPTEGVGFDVVAYFLAMPCVLSHLEPDRILSMPSFAAYPPTKFPSVQNLTA